MLHLRFVSKCSVALQESSKKLVFSGKSRDAAYVASRGLAADYVEKLLESSYDPPDPGRRGDFWPFGPHY